METFQIRSRLIAEAESPEPGLIVSVYEQAPKEAKSSVIAAQTADTMVAISGIYVSVVIVEYVDGSLGISARSDGTVNVQIIMEELGGGGHQTMAAAQLKHITPEAARSRIQTAIDQYREAQKKSGLESGSEQKKKDKQ